MKRVGKQLIISLFLVTSLLFVSACGDVRLSSFGDLTLKKFIKTLNENIAQYNTELVVPELTETIVTTDSGDITIYTSAVSSTITLMIIPSDNGQIIYLRQSKATDAEDETILADDRVFAAVVFALMQTVDENADVENLASELTTDTLWNTAATADADGYHYFYQNRDTANVFTVKLLPTDAESADTTASAE